jgi:hypothetical protein
MGETEVAFEAAKHVFAGHLVVSRWFG